MKFIGLNSAFIDHYYNSMDPKDFPSEIPHEKEGASTSQSILYLILDQLPDGVLVLDGDNHVRLANDAAHRHLDITWLGSGAAPGPDLSDYPHWKEALSQPVERLPFAFEAVLAQGKAFHIEVSYLPGLGKMVRLQDISHFKKLEKVKDEFVHTVSHDLRSPLTAVLGYVGLIERVGPVNEQQLEFIHQAQAGVGTIRHMLDKLLELQRIEAGLDLVEENVLAQALLAQSADAFDFQISRRQQTLTLDLPQTPVVLQGNPIRLRQVFDNLIDNASKYTRPGGNIRLSARAEKDVFIVQVSDNGYGILEDEMPHIFEQFYRGSNALDQTSGAGLGLSIVRSVLDTYQGRIWVESNPGHGTTFTVALPAVDQAQAGSDPGE
ncbi:MAG TPA: ATP-binding protein [Anaerolineales bacterium]|nr:ATP-binding protein [Anaerolineales bacterium]